MSWGKSGHLELPVMLPVCALFKGRITSPFCSLSDHVALNGNIHSNVYIRKSSCSHSVAMLCVGSPPSHIIIMRFTKETDGEGGQVKSDVLNVTGRRGCITSRDRWRGQVTVTARTVFCSGWWSESTATDVLNKKGYLCRTFCRSRNTGRVSRTAGCPWSSCCIRGKRSLWFVSEGGPSASGICAGDIACSNGNVNQVLCIILVYNIYITSFISGFFITVIT